MRFVQGAQALKSVSGPGGAVSRCHVDADRDRFGGGCQPALVGVKHGHEVMQALRIEVDHLKGEIERIKKGPGSIIDPGNHQWFQSAVAPESLMTFVHLIISDLMNAANCALLPAAISTPRSAKRD